MNKIFGIFALTFLLISCASKKTIPLNLLPELPLLSAPTMETKQNPMLRNRYVSVSNQPSESMHHLEELSQITAKELAKLLASRGLTVLDRNISSYLIDEIELSEESSRTIYNGPEDANFALLNKVISMNATPASPTSFSKLLNFGDDSCIYSINISIQVQLVQLPSMKEVQSYKFNIANDFSVIKNNGRCSPSQTELNSAAALAIAEHISDSNSLIDLKNRIAFYCEIKSKKDNGQQVFFKTTLGLKAGAKPNQPVKVFRLNATTGDLEVISVGKIISSKYITENSSYIVLNNSSINQMIRQGDLVKIEEKECNLLCQAESFVK